jgi:15-cis-phytoene synthase
MNVAEAYEACQDITKAQAKNFFYGIRLLPDAKRNAMSALYAFARRIDDISDGDLPEEQKLAALAEVDHQVAELADGKLPNADDPVLCGVHHAASTFPVPVAAFSEIVEGCRRDTTGYEYRTFADTEAYCRLVAGSVGRLSLGVFGCSQPSAGPALADDLGVALQVTNILRDIVEDQQMGRVYLPSDDIERFGCDADLRGPESAMRALIEYYVGVADSFYERGLKLLALLDRRSRACVAAMAGIYRQLLGHISADPLAVLRGRLSLSGKEKLIVAARSLMGFTP